MLGPISRNRHESKGRENKRMQSAFREPTTAEQRLIQRLLDVDFVGKGEVGLQLTGARVRQIDEDGSLEFEPNIAAVPALVAKRVPVEAEGRDEDGIGVHFLLHVVEGSVKELEIYKNDGSPVRRIPDPDSLTLIVLPPET
jgi:hypothetical protein